MAQSARPMSLAAAAQKFGMTVAELQALIKSGECSKGDVDGTIITTYDSKTKKSELQRKNPPATENG